MSIHRRFLLSLFTLLLSSFFGCGSGQLPAGSSSLKSAISCPSNAPCSGSAEVPVTLVDGTDPATFGIPISCSVTASSSTMKFVATPSQPWFAVTPVSATLQPSASTTIGVFSMNAANVSGRNIGTVTVSASGYADNSQMAVELNCNVTGGTCTVAYSCNPKTNPLP